MGRAKATNKISTYGLSPGWAKSGLSSDGLGVAPVIGAAWERAANCPHKRAQRAWDGQTHAANAIAIEGRKLGVQIVNPEPHRQRHVPSMEVRRAKHGHVSEGFVRFTRVEAGSDRSVTVLGPQQDTNKAGFGFMGRRSESAGGGVSALVQPRHVVSQRFHLFVAERIHHLRHARCPGCRSSAGFEIAQRLVNIVLALAR